MRQFITLFILMSPFAAIAGGSVEFDFHAKPLLMKDPAIYDFVTTTLDISKTGDGVRLGKDSGVDQGKRIPPFKFEAKPKSQLGAFTFILTIDETENGLPIISLEPIFPSKPSA